MNITVLGLGKLGLPMAALFAQKNLVLGVDTNLSHVVKLHNGECPIQEPQLKEYLESCKMNLRFSTNPETGYMDFIFMMIPTPSGEDGKFTNEYILKAIESIAHMLKVRVRETNKKPIIIITSTVMPLSTDNIIKPEIERQTGLKCGKDFGLCYNPEFIALGSVIRDMSNPDSILIGESDKETGDALEAFYKHTIGDIPVYRMSFVNAEIAKLAVNCYVTTKISYANTIAQLCGNIEGGNAHEVLRFLGSDTRIGGKYLKPGLSFGGPCLIPDSLIQTSRGLVEIKNVEVGDQVLSHDGCYHIVTETMVRKYKGDIIKITPEGMPQMPLYCTPEHPVFGAKRIIPKNGRYKIVSTTGQRRMNYSKYRSNFDFIEASELRQGDFLSYPSIRINEIPPPKIILKTHYKSPVKNETELTPDLARVFGLYLAEGSTWRKEIKFSLHKDETDLVEDVNDVLKQHFGIKTSIHAYRGNGISTRTTCIRLAEYLRNTFGTHNYNKCIPDEWLRLPEEYIREMLKGLWYGDGSNSANRYTYATTSRKLFNQIRIMMLRIGIAHSTKIYTPRISKDGVNHRESFFIVVGNPIEVKKMSDLLPRIPLDIGIRNKKSITMQEGRMVYHIAHVETMPYEGNVHNLEVLESNSYATESVVVHNCFPRDGRAFAKLIDEQNAIDEIPASVDLFNTLHKEYVANKITSLVNPSGYPKIAVLGLSYKPDTPVTEESPALNIVKELNEMMDGNGEVVCYDPLAKCEGVNQVDTIEECLDNADLCVIATSHKEFSEISAETFKGIMNSPVILDCWNCITPKEGVVIHRLGVN